MANSETGSGPDGAPAGVPVGSPAGIPAADGTATRRRSPMSYVVIALVAGLAAAGWGYVMMKMGGGGSITPQIVAYHAVDDANFQVTFSVSKPGDQQVRCIIRALDQRFAEVGRREVFLPRGTDQADLTERLSTSARASMADVKECRQV